jgi:diketogulonate reductase-like aldo/keto reductase
MPDRPSDPSRAIPNAVSRCVRSRSSTHTTPANAVVARIAENLDVFEFALTADEIAAIDGLDTGIRGGPTQDEIDFRTFDRTIPD